jgi:hypothetical protein
MAAPSLQITSASSPARCRPLCRSQWSSAATASCSFCAIVQQAIQHHEVTQRRCIQKQGSLCAIHYKHHATQKQHCNSSYLLEHVQRTAAGAVVRRSRRPLPGLNHRRPVHGTRLVLDASLLLGLVRHMLRGCWQSRRRLAGFSELRPQLCVGFGVGEAVVRVAARGLVVRGTTGALAATAVGT